MGVRWGLVEFDADGKPCCAVMCEGPNDVFDLIADAMLPWVTCGGIRLEEVVPDDTHD